ncbi:dermonecrotic toxin domain-containing protein [Pseudomonas sp. NPDC087358]|uniref:dermonecrotic toxin domain-containing protein n=1 Tax=Pseudomonas sp. NPDC087358 TaxID=3364439 RepID=UPI00384F805D
MSIATLDYFHSASLRQRYVDELDDALRSHRLRPEARLWLQGPARPLVEGGPDPVRVDRLLFNDGSSSAFELSGALMLSHQQADDPQVYLYTLADGIEVFPDRHALLAALRQRFAQGDADTLFESERIEGDPFHAQMLNLVDHQAGHVGQVAAQLRLTPSLPDVLTAALARQLRAKLARMSIDPATHLLQIVSASSREVELTPVTQTLAQAVFDDYCKVQIEEGFERRFLCAQGLIADSADAQRFAQALTEATAQAGSEYGQQLTAFWQDIWRAGRTRRDLAIETLGDSYRCALYRCRHNASLDAASVNTLRSVLGDAPAAADLRCSRLKIRIGYSNFYPLAATFAVQRGAAGVGSLLWFTPDHSLVGFADVAALAAHLGTVQGRQQLRALLAIEDQPLLLQQGAVQLQLEPIRTPVMADRIDSILALQARNLAYALGSSNLGERVTAMIDDALDVRQLLDPRQSQLDAGRWRRAAPFDFCDVWRGAGSDTSLATAPEEGDSSISSDAGGDRTSRLILSASWRELAQSFDSRAERLRQSDIVLLDYAAQALQPYVSVLVRGPVRARDIRVQWLEPIPLEASVTELSAVPVSETQQLMSLDLVSLLLECVTGHRAGVPSTMEVRVEPSAARVAALAELIPRVLEKAAVDFTRRYADYFRQSRVGLQRQGDSHAWPDMQALSLREDALRLDLALGKREGRFDSGAIGMARQMLDRPVRALRIALGEPLTEAFSVSLAYDPHPAALLCDTLVLRQTLEPDAPVMLWRATTGWRQFASIEHLQHALQLNLLGPHRERWLKLLGERDRRLLETYLLDSSRPAVQIRLQRIDGHVIDSLQAQTLKRGQQDLRQLCLSAARCHLPARLFTSLACAAELDRQLVEMLDGLAVRIDCSIFEAMLPSWLISASLADLDQYNKIFKRFYLASDGGKDFLFDVPALQDLARDRLTAQLSQDFPDQLLNPDAINVISRRYVSAIPTVGELPSGVAAATIVHTETLTDYAINRFVGVRDSALSVDPAGGEPVAGLLRPDYLRQLVRQLDVGAGYMALLRKALSSDDVHYAERQRLFVEQLPPALMALALTEKVQGKLTARAYEFICSVLDMPDGVAREPVDGVRVILSPLQLVADRGVNPDTVTGVYVIFPEAPDAGPVVLYAIYHPLFVFREYPNRTALTAAIRTDESLQRLLLQRVDPQVHRRYARGGFREPHLASSVGLFDFDLPLHRPGPVALATVEEKGNALQLLFKGTVKVLLDMGANDSVTNQQVDQSGRAFLVTLGLEQVLCLLPGKWATLVTLWQSHALIRASALSISGHRWGEALSEFSAALGVLVTARRQAIEERVPEDPLDPQPASDSVDEKRQTPYASWGGISLNAEQRVRLQDLQAQNVALNAMRHDELLNLYLDPDSAATYAVVDGKVFEVNRLPEGEWVIVGADGTTGPQLILDDDQRWQLDLNVRLRGGGGVITRFQAATALSSVEQVMVIEASGMPEIRLQYRARARQIGEAHAQAKRYLENCLDNLNVNTPGAVLEPRVNGVVADFFGAASPDQQLLGRVESAIRSLFAEVMDASLSPFSSPRFVVGSNRPGHDRVTAFMVPADPQRRIFLTERFFRVPYFRLKPEAIAAGFDPLRHSQAAVLLHELSHQVLNTKDIAYLEANSPYPDLLLQNTASNFRSRAQIERLQNSRLSHQTLHSDLFKYMEDGQWRDISREDGIGYSTILQITETRTLDDARKVFLSDVHKRSRVMLKNADSMTLLILRLGRHNYVAPQP